MGEISGEEKGHIRYSNLHDEKFLLSPSVTSVDGNVLEKNHSLSESRVAQRTFSSSVSANSKVLSVTEENARNLSYHS